MMVENLGIRQNMNLEINIYIDFTVKRGVISG